MSLEVVVAAAFRHTRKDRMQKNDFIYYLALDRKWMSREQAQAVLDRAVEKGLIVNREGWLSPLIDISTVEVPLGYRPPANLLTEEEPARDLLQRISRQTGRSLTDITAELNQIIHEQFADRLKIEAAAVLLAKRYRVPFEDLLERLKTEVMKTR